MVKNKQFISKTGSRLNWRFICSKCIKTTAIIAVFLGLTSVLSLMSEIHGKSLPEQHFTGGLPSIIALLDSEFFMGLIFVITLGIVIYVLYLFWVLHEVAVHRAEKMSSAHTQIVFALSLCGLFIDKAWWVLAIVIAFGRWDVIGNAISSIINKGIRGQVK